MDDYLYWTDWTYHGILRAKKFHGENVTVVAQAALLPYGLKIHHKVQQPDGKQVLKSMLKAFKHVSLDRNQNFLHKQIKDQIFGK